MINQTLVSDDSLESDSLESDSNYLAYSHQSLSSFCFSRDPSILSDPLFKLNFQFTSHESPISLNECKKELIGKSVSEHLYVPPIDQQSFQVFEYDQNSLSHSINCMEFDKQGELLAIGTENGDLKIYNSLIIFSHLRKKYKHFFVNFFNLF